MKLRQRKRQIMRQRAVIPRGMRCPECGKRGPHWVSAADGWSSFGFWACAKFYGADGRRIRLVNFGQF
jgi:transcription elongation factor Elf1